MKYRLPVLIFALLLFFGFSCWPMQVEAAYGTIDYWDGDWSVDLSPVCNLLEASDVYKYDLSEDAAESSIVNVTYETSGTSMVSLTGLTVGNYLHGTFQTTVTARSVSSSTVPDYGFFMISAEPHYTDNLVIYVERVSNSWSNHSYTFRITLDFDSYKISEINLRLPINLNVQCVNGFKNTTAVPPSMDVQYSVIDDYTGTIMEYSDLRDIPTLDGDFANQNQEIIDGIDENRSALNSFKTAVGSWFSDLTSNLLSWYNGLTSTINSRFDQLLNQNNDEHQETINGYQGTGTPEASEKFDESAGELEDIESDLTGITNTGVDDYATAAFDTGIISSLGPSLVYVVTWFTNFWNMGGIFTTLLNVGLALFVAFFILRLNGGSK